MSGSTTPPPLSTVKESWSQEEMAAREAMNDVPAFEGDGELPMPQTVSRQSSHQSSRQSSHQSSRQHSRQPSPDKSPVKSTTKSSTKSPTKFSSRASTKSPTKSQLQAKKPQQQEEEDAEDDPPLTQTRLSVDRRQTRTPELQQRRSQRVSVQPSPSTPGRIAPFDWDDFEARYQKALAEADEKEKAILEEFDQLVKVRQTHACSLELFCADYDFRSTSMCGRQHLRATTTSAR